MAYGCLRTAVILVACATWSLPALAANCSKADKKIANDVLLAVQQDESARAALLKKHMPFGAHNGADANEVLLFQHGYIMSHDADLRTATWVSYVLTKRDMEDAAGKKRINCFRKDPRLSKTDAATPTDYKEKVYDQGHMANDADLKDLKIEQLNSYMMSNMSPQHCRFNRGIWLSLEHLTRIWAVKYETIYVTSGAIFDRDGTPGRDADEEAQRMLSRNGKSRVAVPSAYYKTIMRKDGDSWKSVTFLLPHTNDAYGKKWNAVKPHVMGMISTIEEIEIHAGVKLHPDLDRVELAQATAESIDWDFSEGKNNLEPSPPNACIEG